MTANSNTSTNNKPAAATAAAALSAMLAFNACPAQSFQPTFLAPTPRMMHHVAFGSPAVPATTMRCSSPWDLDCGGMQPFRGRLQRLQQLGPMTFAPPGVFQNSQLRVKDPEVVETDGSYKLTFDLPAEVEQDDFDVSVSGRLLTVKATVTHEDSGSGRGGWVRRSSRTDSVSRSFVLPEGVSASGVTTSFSSEGKLEVKFNKDSAPGAAGAAATGSPGTVDIDSEDKKPVSSSSADYLSSLSGAKAADTAIDVGDAAPEAQPSSAESTQSPASGAAATSTSPPESERASRPRSVFEAIDQEFGDFAKAMWGEDMLGFPSQEEVAKRAEAMREARAKRVMAVRRATMATDVSELEDGSYSIKVALPEGATREDVKLVITPENYVRVSFATEGRRSIYKDVRLPKDALLSEISAKFVAEQQQQQQQQEKSAAEDGEGSSTAEQGVSSLEIKVGRELPQASKRIDIM